MAELADILCANDVPVDAIRTGRSGRIDYSDAHQVLAEPPLRPSPSPSRAT